MKFFERLKNKFPNINSILAVVGVVLIWRCVWSLMDYYFLPGNPVVSYIIGGVIGVIILLLDDLKLDELGKH